MGNKLVNMSCGPRPQCDVYIGRRRGTEEHFGNPFSHKGDTLAQIVLPNRGAAIQAYRDWLAGTAWQDVEPKRRLWVIAHIPELVGKSLGCWCTPLPCHGEILSELAELSKFGSDWFDRW